MVLSIQYWYSALVLDHYHHSTTSGSVFVDYGLLVMDTGFLKERNWQNIIPWAFFCDGARWKTDSFDKVTNYANVPKNPVEQSKNWQLAYDWISLK